MNDPIVALATAPGKGAIAIIRISGYQCFNVFEKVVSEKDFLGLKHRHPMIVSLFQNSKEQTPLLLDKAVVIPFVAPASYTGEDVLEIHSHGGMLIPRLILNALISHGARYAKPGEFTERAFLNGKVDLVQAEAVDALISATTYDELNLAQDHHGGFFTTSIKQLKNSIVDLLSLLELELDFSDEDVEFANRESLHSLLILIEEVLSDLSKSYKRSILIKEGIRIAIVGKPNVGKSSLLNFILKNERAIVTDIEGTTRDSIEEAIELNGHKFVFIDTAGIRETIDIVEREGIRKTKEKIDSADCILFVLDNNREFSKSDEVILDLLKDYKSKHIFAILNKSDLENKFSANKRFVLSEYFKVIEFSCKTGKGFSEIEANLNTVFVESVPIQKSEQIGILNIRQKSLIDNALVSTRSALKNFSAELSQEFIAADMRHVLNELSELIGEVTTEDILGNIFANFCIGK